MRRILYGDIAALARALMCVDAEERVELCHRMIREAQCAEAFRRETGQAHPVWGSGSLEEVARLRPLAPISEFGDAHHLQAWCVVLDCLLEAVIRIS